MDRYGRVRTAEEFQFLQDRFSFLPEHGVTISAKGVLIYNHPLGNIGGKLFHREINLIEVLPPPVSDRCVWEVAGLLFVEGGNMGSNVPASHSLPTVVSVSPVRSPFFIPSVLPVGAQVGKSNASTQKIHSVHVVPSSVEEIESNDTGLCPCNARRTMYVARLLGGFGDILSV
ncbi:unnamed protein product [Lactuca saligna]|uniref:Uncharacterized protein n=1 Tax=Lactuca saligna TaxID=75948 RepID=A0AA35YW07_LACSI|nr:unnamed protein product [Lactuca saligna]